MSCVKFPCKKRRKVENFCEQSGGAYQKYFSLSETPTCILSNHSINCKVTERFFTYGGIPYEAAQPLGLRHCGRHRPAVRRSRVRLERAVHPHRRRVHRLDEGPAEPDVHPGDDPVLYRLPAVRPAGRKAQRQKRRAPGRGPVSGRLFHRQPLPVAADAVPGLRRAVRPGLRPQLQRRDEHHGPLVPGPARPDLRRAADGLRRRQLSDRQAVPGLDTCRRRRLAHQLSGAGHRMLCGAGGVLLLFRSTRCGLYRPGGQGRQCRVPSRCRGCHSRPNAEKKTLSGCITSGPSRSALPDWP